MTLEKMDVNALQAAVQQAGGNWVPGITSVSELSEQEKLLRLGAVPPLGEASLEERELRAAARRSSAVARAEGATANFDTRNINGQNFVTDIRDQGACGSCVAFGSIATVEGTFRRQRSDPNLAVDLSEAELFYCIARQQGRNCSNGWWCDKGLDAFKTDGVTDETCYPYTAGDQNCTNRCTDWQNRLTKISGWHVITSVADMKSWIATRGPLSCAFTVYNDFFSYRSGVYTHLTGGVAGGHCVSCIGYNDDGGYWICKNSWGKNWGDNGFFQIAYGQCGIDAEMWAVDGVIETGWLNVRKVIGLWAIDQDRNAWVYLDGNIGWRRIAFDNDNIFFNLLTQLASAKLTKSTVNVYQENGVIKQAYVFQNGETIMTTVRPPQAIEGTKQETHSSGAAQVPNLTPPHESTRMNEETSMDDAKPTQEPPKQSKSVERAEDAAPNAMPSVASSDISGVAAWNNDKRVHALWSSNQNRNSWVYITGVAWKKFASNSDSAVVALTMLAAHAKQMQTNYTYREESDGMIHETYVW